MNTNEELLHLYESKWSTLCKVLDEKGLPGYEYNPLLLGVKDVKDFDSADIKVMFFGQDMSEGPWYEYDRHTQPLSECMMSIRTFDNKEGSVELNGKRRAIGMGGGMNSFIDRFNDKFKDRKVRYVWNDIIKLGRNLKGNPEKRYSIADRKRVFRCDKRRNQYSQAASGGILHRARGILGRTITKESRNK